jgi:soluble lytic murein transglycosylase-like protein
MKTGLGIEELGFSTGAQKSGGFAFASIPNPQSSILSLNVLILAFCFCLPSLAHAGAQAQEALSASVQAVLQRAVSDQAVPKHAFATQGQADVWLAEMSQRLVKRIPDREDREDFLTTVHYEATRAGLDPHLVLGLIEVESGFRKYAVSNAGARGYMQVMPFWTRALHAPEHDLFHLRTNLRYGCTILRYYLDIEKGNLYRALGRYNGSLGKAEYPNLVKAAWHKHWAAPQRTAGSQSGPAS